MYVREKRKGFECKDRDLIEKCKRNPSKISMCLNRFVVLQMKRGYEGKFVNMKIKSVKLQSHGERRFPKVLRNRMQRVALSQGADRSRTLSCANVPNFIELSCDDEIKSEKSGRRYPILSSPSAVFQFSR